jgi:hypothetical protein
MNSTTLLLLALVLIAPTANATFRCADKDGKTVYMERPCNTYGYTTAKVVRDPPKGDGSATMLRPGQAMIGSQSTQASDRSGRDPNMRVPMQCGTDRVLCFAGDVVMCGGEKRRCDSD